MTLTESLPQIHPGAFTLLMTEEQISSITSLWGLTSEIRDHSIETERRGEEDET